MRKRFGVVDPAVQGRFAAAIERLQGQGVNRRTAPRYRVERGVHVTVLRVGGGPYAVRLAQIPNHRPCSAPATRPAFRCIAHERGHHVAATHERVEHGAADISRRAREEDPHRRATAYFKI